MITRTLGGDRIGSGKKMKVHMHGYERSTHNLSYVFRNTQAPGTLVPFCAKVALPGDTWDIWLDALVMSKPSIGPLLGSFKLQLDMYYAPIRLYQAQLHNNKLGIGRKMHEVKLPIMNLAAIPTPVIEGAPVNYDLDNAQINASCIHKYHGIAGVHANSTLVTEVRQFQCVKLLMYWDIYKNYYANTQEEIGVVIHTIINNPSWIEAVEIFVNSSGTSETLPPTGTPGTPIDLFASQTLITIELASGYTTIQNLDNYLFVTSAGTISLRDLIVDQEYTPFEITGTWYVTVIYNATRWGYITATSWNKAEAYQLPPVPPNLVTFPLSNLDDMREEILERATVGNVPVNISSFAPIPYSYVVAPTSVIDYDPHTGYTQEGLAIKTYQSDVYNNWLNTEWIDEVNNSTAVDVGVGSFTIEALILAKKLWEMDNRIAVSGGTYQDWVEVIYDHAGFFRAEAPIYIGGLSKEIIFQEIVSNTQTEGQPLGTLAGKGTLAKKHKGGNVHTKTDEHGYIYGIVSITPRIDYSQGNEWDNQLLTMDDFHQPGLDAIGFEDSMNEERAWWDVYQDGGNFVRRSAGKLPAWTNYRTAVNKTYGNFAIGMAQVGEMFMTLNRRFEPIADSGQWKIKDLTTYVDPAKFNHIFAQTSLDAMNFWLQIAVDIEVRRKMSARVMPSL